MAYVVSFVCFFVSCVGAFPVSYGSIVEGYMESKQWNHNSPLTHWGEFSKLIYKLEGPQRQGVESSRILSRPGSVKHLK